MDREWENMNYGLSMTMPYASLAPHRLWGRERWQKGDVGFGQEKADARQNQARNVYDKVKDLVKVSSDC
jgi:hypothetical protein